MLYVNGKLLDLTQHSDYKEKIAELRDDYGKTLCLKSKRELKINPSGLAEAFPAITIPLIAVSVGEGGAEEWAYSENAVVVRDGQIQLTTRQLIVSGGELYINLDKQPDLAYFLVYKHPFIKNGKFRIHDERQLARKKAEERKEKARLESAIYSEGSTLNTNLSTLRMVAKRWGIKTTDKMTKDMIQNELYEAVMRSEEAKRKGGASRGVSGFLEDIKLKDTTKLGAFVYDCIEKGIVTFNNRYNEWRIPNSDGTEITLTAVASQDVNIKEEVLLERVVTDPSVRSMLEKSVSPDKPVDLNVKAYDIDIIRETNDFELIKTAAKELGVKIFGLKKDVLRELVIQALHEQGVKV